MKRQTVFILQIVVLGIIPIALSAQPGRGQTVNDITGYIKDWKTAEALPYANILLVGENRGTASNSDGYFVLVDAPVGVCSLVVSYIGYETGTIRVQNDPEQRESIIIELKFKVLEGQKVTVVAETYEIWQNTGEISHVTISPRELQTLPTLGEVDIFTALKLLPGVSSVGDGKAGLYIRGGTPDQNLVILDGMTVYHVDHFFGMFSAFNADAIKDVQLYTGGFPARYGGRLSSVVELTGKTGGDYRQLSLGANLLSANVSFETPFWEDKGSWLISARRSYTDILRSPLYDSMYEFVTGTESTTGSQPMGPGGGMRGGAFMQEVVPSFYYYDLNSKLSINPTGRDFINLSFYTGRDYLDKSRDLNLQGMGFRTPEGMEFETRMDENRTDWGNIGGSMRWGHQWNSRSFSSLMISNSVYTSNYERNLSVGGANIVGVADSTRAARGLGSFAQDEFNNVNDLSLRLDNQWQLGKRHKMEYGVFAAQVATDYSATVRDTISILDVRSQSRTTALYVQDQWQFSPRLTMTFGLRSTYHDQTDAFYQAPRLSFGLNLTGKLQLKGAWGHYYQFINTITNENVLQGSKEFWLSTDEYIRPGFAEHSILGLTYNTPAYLLEVEGYYKTLDNLVEFTRRFQDSADYLNYFFFGTGVAQGLEFLAQKKHGAFTGWISYTLANVEHTFPNLNEGEPFPASHDRLHELTVVGSYHWGPWNFSSTLMYSTGNPYTAPESQYFLEMLDGQELSYIHVGEKNAYRLPEYQRMDLSVTRKFEYGDFDWDVGLSIYNVFNHHNVSYRDYDLDVTPIIVSDMLMLGFTPTIFIKANLK